MWVYELSRLSTTVSVAGSQARSIFKVGVHVPSNVHTKHPLGTGAISKYGHNPARIRSPGAKKPPRVQVCARIEKAIYILEYIYIFFPQLFLSPAPLAQYIHRLLLYYAVTSLFAALPTSLPVTKNKSVTTRSENLMISTQLTSLPGPTALLCRLTPLLSPHRANVSDKAPPCSIWKLCHTFTHQRSAANGLIKPLIYIHIFIYI